MKRSCSAVAATLAAATTLAAASAAVADVSGFGNVTLNAGPLTSGVPTVSGDTLTLTSIGTPTMPLEYQATSAFVNTKQSVTGFHVQFTYQYTGSVTQVPADGFAFVLQNDPRGPQALGDRGGALGVGTFPPGTGQGTVPNTEITPSVAIDFTVAPGSTDPKGPGTVLNINGLTPQQGGLPTQSVAPIDFLNSDPILVALTYQGTTLTETLTDTLQPTKTYTTAYTADLPALLGANTAHVGFTGGTGDANAGQQITGFQYQTLPAVPEPSPLMPFALGAGLLVLAVRQGGRSARRCRPE